MIFDTPIILYTVISFSVIAIALALLSLIKTQNIKDFCLKAFASLCFLFHISYIWYDYLTQGYAFVKGNVLFPVYFCGLNMYLLLLVAFMPKKGKIFEVLSEFLFYAGTLGGIVGTVCSEFYNANPDLSNYYVLKSLLSHSFMLLASLYLLIGGYVKIRVKNIISYIIGIMICVYDGIMIDLIFIISGLPHPNAMYLSRPPLSGVPWLSSYTIVSIVGVLIQLVTMVYEQIALERENRWYSKLKKYFKHRRRDNAN